MTISDFVAQMAELIRNRLAPKCSQLCRQLNQAVHRRVNSTLDLPGSLMAAVKFPCDPELLLSRAATEIRRVSAAARLMTGHLYQTPTAA